MFWRFPAQLLKLQWGQHIFVQSWFGGCNDVVLTGFHHNSRAIFKRPKCVWSIKPINIDFEAFVWAFAWTQLTSISTLKLGLHAYLFNREISRSYENDCCLNSFFFFFTDFPKLLLAFLVALSYLVRTSLMEPPFSSQPVWPLCCSNLCLLWPFFAERTVGVAFEGQRNAPGVTPPVCTFSTDAGHLSREQPSFRRMTTPSPTHSDSSDSSKHESNRVRQHAGVLTKWNECLLGRNSHLPFV